MADVADGGLRSDVGPGASFQLLRAGKNRLCNEPLFIRSEQIIWCFGQTAQTEYVAGDSYSIADIAILPWTRTYKRQNVAIEDYPHVAAWREKLGQREAVIAGMKVGAEWREDLKNLSADEFAKLFGTK